MLLNIIYLFSYILLLTLIDCYFYGCCKQCYMGGKSKINKGIFNFKIFENFYNLFRKPINWLMENIDNPKTFIIKIDIRYRLLLQKPLEIGLLILLYFLTHNFGLIFAILITHYWLVYDRLFTIFLNREYMVKEIKEDPTWLKYIFQSGFWLFRPYSYIKYNLSAILGILFAIISTIIFFNITF